MRGAVAGVCGGGGGAGTDAGQGQGTHNFVNKDHVVGTL